MIALCKVSAGTISFVVYEMKIIGCPTAVRECTMWKTRVTAFLLTFLSRRLGVFEPETTR